MITRLQTAFHRPHGFHPAEPSQYSMQIDDSNHRKPVILERGPDTTVAADSTQPVQQRSQILIPPGQHGQPSDRPTSRA